MPRGIYQRGVINRNPHSEVTRAKIALANTGKRQSLESIEKIRLAKVGAKYPNRKRPPKKGRTSFKRVCLFCKNEFVGSTYLPNKKFCDRTCSARAHADLSRARILKHIDREKQKEAARAMRGTNHPRWVHDRSKLKDDAKDRGGSLHKEWSREVKKRDSWRCKMSNKDCSGRLESHHILSWKEYPELRYEINNGITVCHYHHPRTKKAEAEHVDLFRNILREL